MPATNLATATAATTDATAADGEVPGHSNRGEDISAAQGRAIGFPPARGWAPQERGRPAPAARLQQRPVHSGRVRTGGGGTGGAGLQIGAAPATLRRSVPSQVIPVSILLAALAVLLGGVLKGAIGTGMPLIAAPALTILFDVQTAVAVLVVPNLLSNVWQAWQFRGRLLPLRFLVLFGGGRMLGVAAGSVMLAKLPQEALLLLVALAVFAYVGLRLARPGWTLGRAMADRLCAAAGVLGGILQGATGISAPASISFLNAMRLPREEFIGTISVFFAAMTAMQIPALWALRLLGAELIGYGFAALALSLLAMPVGNWLGRRASPELFDRLMLATLAMIGLRIVFDLLV